MRTDGECGKRWVRLIEQQERELREDRPISSGRDTQNEGTHL